MSREMLSFPTVFHWSNTSLPIHMILVYDQTLQLLVNLILSLLIETLYNIDVMCKHF